MTAETMLQTLTGQALTPAKFEQLEQVMLQQPQADCPVVHRFSPGLYIREVTLKAGVFAVGHYQKTVHVNIMLKGRVTMLDENGTPYELKASHFYVAQPGRKIGYIHEDVVWQNIYPTTETDIEKLEEMFLIKTDTWNAHKDSKTVIDRLNHEASRDDYFKMLEELGYTHEQVRAQTENTADQIPFPSGSYKVMVTDSPIEGKGLFATADIVEGENICLARIDGKRTPAGRFTNHSICPNAEMKVNHYGDITLVATKNISGSHGGSVGEEITIDYRQAREAARVADIRDMAKACEWYTEDLRKTL